MEHRRGGFLGLEGLIVTILVDMHRADLYHRSRTIIDSAANLVDFHLLKR